MKRKIKLAWLHPHLTYWVGGTKFIYEVIKRLKPDFEVTIFVETASPKIINKFKKEININIITISNRSSYSLLYWLFSPYYFNKEIKILRNKLKNFDILLPSMFPMSYLAYRARNKNQKILQYIFEPYAFFYDREFVRQLPFIKKIGSRIIGWLYQKFDYLAVKNSDRVLTLSKTTGLQIKKLFQVTACVTYEGVDTDFFKPVTDRLLAKKYYNNNLIIHSTDYLPIKGTKYVIKALPLVIKKYPNTKLLITSTVENNIEKNKIIKLAKKLKIINHIEFLGFVDFDKLPCYYSLADVYIHAGFSKSSGATTMSLPVKEALACETPVIRSNDTKEEVIDGKCGYLVNPKNNLETANAIIKLLINKRLREKMGKFGRLHILKYFTWNKVTDQFKISLIKLLN